MSIRATLEARLTEVPGLDQRRSRYGHGGAYFVGEREVAHFHGENRMDVRLTREVIREHKARGPMDPRVRTRGSSADWVEVRVSETSDLAYALSLVEEAARANA